MFHMSFSGCHLAHLHFDRAVSYSVYMVVLVKKNYQKVKGSQWI